MPAQNSLIIGGQPENPTATHGPTQLYRRYRRNLPGASNVSFTIFDIDVTTNSDIINNIYGVAHDGSHVAATITNVGSAVTRDRHGPEPDC